MVSNSACAMAACVIGWEIVEVHDRVEVVEQPRHVVVRQEG